ncbi:hypothetical protein AB0H63_29145 [Micromonospora echinospora]|uniref:hypothetical protein n=1 Tax=Micromonospora echinospora TaxID=1877 RepID=UPI00340B4B33
MGNTPAVAGGKYFHGVTRPARMRLSVSEPFVIRVLFGCLGMIPLLVAVFLVFIGALIWTNVRWDGAWWLDLLAGVFIYGVLFLAIYVLGAGALRAFALVTYSGWLRGTTLIMRNPLRKEQVDLSIATVRYDDRSSILTATDPRSGTELTLNIDAFGNGMLPAAQLTALADAISAGRSAEDESQQPAFAVVRKLRALVGVASSGPPWQLPGPMTRPEVID